MASQMGFNQFAALCTVSSLSRLYKPIRVYSIRWHHFFCFKFICALSPPTNAPPTRLYWLTFDSNSGNVYRSLKQNDKKFSPLAPSPPPPHFKRSSRLVTNWFFLPSYYYFVNLINLVLVQAYQRESNAASEPLSPVPSWTFWRVCSAKRAIPISSCEKKLR